MEINDNLKLISFTKKTTPPKSKDDPKPIEENTVVFKGENGIKITITGYEADRFEKIDIGREATLVLEVEKRKQKQVTEF